MKTSGYKYSWRIIKQSWRSQGPLRVIARVALINSYLSQTILKGTVKQDLRKMSTYWSLKRMSKKFLIREDLLLAARLKINWISFPITLPISVLTTIRLMVSITLQVGILKSTLRLLSRVHKGASQGTTSSRGTGSILTWVALHRFKVLRLLLFR